LFVAKRLKEERIVYLGNSYFAVAVCLAVLTGAIIAILRWRNSLAVTNRLQRMMLCCGIDEDANVRADQLRKLDMVAVRLRCRVCPITDLCERWLDGASIASHSSCPNAWHFIAAASSGQPPPDSGYMNRWIVRLR